MPHAFKWRSSTEHLLELVRELVVSVCGMLHHTVVSYEITDEPQSQVFLLLLSSFSCCSVRRYTLVVVDATHLELHLGLHESMPFLEYSSNVRHRRVVARRPHLPLLFLLQRFLQPSYLGVCNCSQFSSTLSTHTDSSVTLGPGGTG